MTKEKYEEIWQKFVTGTKNGTVDMIERMHGLLFYDGKPMYDKLTPLELKILISDLECMFHVGVQAGITDVLRAMHGEE